MQRLAMLWLATAPYLHAMPVDPAAGVPPRALVKAPPVCAAGATAFGTDVSGYNTTTNWASVRQGGLTFAFIKATEGITSINARFPADWGAAKKQGLVRGAYHYFRPKSDPTLAAQTFLNLVQPAAAATDLPAVFDWESADGVPVQTQIGRALTWLGIVEKATGRTPIIYVSPAYWIALGSPAQFARYPLFIADYGVACPRVPFPWTTWTFWQAGVGTVPGLSADADQDLFNGTASALAKVGR